MRPLTLDARRDGDRCTLMLRGELDIVTSPALADAALQACGDGIRQLTVDLSDVDFIDSAGLRAHVAVANTPGDIAPPG